MSKNTKVVVKLAEWMVNKLGTTKEYWDMHLPLGAIIKLRKYARLRREVEKYKRDIEEMYGDYFITESEKKVVSLSRKELHEILEKAVRYEDYNVLKLDQTKAIQRGYISVDKIHYETTEKFTAINTIEKYIEGLDKKA